MVDIAIVGGKKALWSPQPHKIHTGHMNMTSLLLCTGALLNLALLEV